MIVDCMACLAHAAENDDPADTRFVTLLEGVTHYVAKISPDMAYPLCDFGLDGMLRWSARRIFPDKLIRQPEEPHG